MLRLQQTYQNIVTLIYENAIVTLFGGVKYTTEHLVIFQIRAYDRKHGTEYEKTLRTYVLCMKNREEAAEKLSIHKNTLGYRLSRIMDIFDLPLEDSRTSLNLLCTALMLEIDNSLGDRKPPHEK